MRLEPLSLDGVHLLVPDRHEDDRGYFARIFDADLLRAAGLEAGIVQSSVSYNRRAGTLRGMHWQEEPHAEAKYVRCTKGAIHDVIIDLRPSSGTYLQWLSVALTQENTLTLYIPKGFAHGFQTMRDDCEVHYQMTAPFVPEAARGMRFDDASVGIVWPDVSGERILSQKDRAHRDFSR